jgi:hypothetical protein
MKDNKILTTALFLTFILAGLSYTFATGALNDNILFGLNK